MATTIGTEYDHIDITHGVGTIRHPLKDASARENLVKVSDTQPESTDNVLWIKETPESEIQVPTYAELEEIAIDISDVKHAMLSFLSQMGPLIPHIAFASEDHNGADTVAAINSAISVLSQSYSITKSLSHCYLSNSATIISYGSSYLASVAAETDYELSSVIVIMGSTDISATAYHDGTISIPSVTGNILITAVATQNGQVVYSITKNLTNCVMSNTDVSVDAGLAYTTTITANSGYTLDSVTVSMNGTDITSTAYNSGTGEISIASVTGNIIVTAAASAPTLQGISAALNLENDIIRVSNGLNDLKAYLTVTAIYSDSSTAVLPSGDYTLVGSLELATGDYDMTAQTITVSSGGKTATFSVNVYNDMTQNKTTLPSGYTQLAMVESVGSGCYVDTGVLGSTVDHVEYGIQAQSGIGNGTNWHVLSGSRTWYPYFRQGNSGARNFQGKNETTSGSATSIDTTWEPNTNYVIQAYPSVVINSETAATIASAGSAENANLYVFARNAGTSGPLNFGNIRMFYIKMFDSQDQMIHYFIPCKNGSDVAGLYDTVGETFFPSSGASAMVAGGEVA